MADSRLNLVLPLSMAMLGTLAALSPVPTKWDYLVIISTSLAVFFLVLSIAFAVFASFPRTSGPEDSLIFFGGIASRNLSQYESAVNGMSTDEYLEDLIRQSHRNAQIADRKYIWVQRSMTCLFISFLPWVIALFSLYRVRL